MIRSTEVFFSTGNGLDYFFLYPSSNLDDKSMCLCLLCGTPIYATHYNFSECRKHLLEEHCDWISAGWLSREHTSLQKTNRGVIKNKKQIVQKKKAVHINPDYFKRQYPLKPWKDPQSLFCSPRLKEIIKKEPLSGDECRNALRKI